MEFISNIVLKQIDERDIVNKEYLEYYRYGLKLLMNNVFNILLVVSAGVVIGRVYSVICYMVVFGLTRMHTGGYHAKTHFQCITLYIMMAFGGLYLLDLIQNEWIYAISIVFSNIIICFFAPVDTKYKRYENDIKENFRFKAKRFIVVLDIIAIFLWILGGKSYTKILVLAITFQCITVFLQLIINKYDKEETDYDK